MENLKKRERERERDRKNEKLNKQGTEIDEKRDVSYFSTTNTLVT